MATRSTSGVTVPSVGAGVLAAAVVGVGARGWYLGTYSTAFLAGCAMLAVGIVASQRTMWRHTRPTEPGALGNAALFLLAGAGKLGGVRVGVGALETAGEALFALAVVYFLVRADSA
ncbi:hypothetical protein [Halobaculum sp. P14]|uniref:hypothetical protein n=1 Tax=Halobaculum sp. P14 TaxID=3421638 RepID=UPI003EBC7142